MADQLEVTGSYPHLTVAVRQRVATLSGSPPSRIEVANPRKPSVHGMGQWVPMIVLLCLAISCKTIVAQPLFLRLFEAPQTYTARARAGAQSVSAEPVILANPSRVAAASGQAPLVRAPSVAPSTGSPSHAKAPQPHASSSAPVFEATSGQVSQPRKAKTSAAVPVTALPHHAAAPQTTPEASSTPASKASATKTPSRGLPQAAHLTSSAAFRATGAAVPHINPFPHKYPSDAASSFHHSSPLASGTPVQLNPSVMLVGLVDWLPTGPKTSRCTEMVDRASQMGGDRLNWFTTHYW